MRDKKNTDKVFDDSRQDFVDPDDLSCTWCDGDQYFYGDDLPGFDWSWHDPEDFHDCPACRGTGLRKFQTLF